MAAAVRHKLYRLVICFLNQYSPDDLQILAISAFEKNLKAGLLLCYISDLMWITSIDLRLRLRLYYQIHGVQAEVLYNISTDKESNYMNRNYM